MAKSVGSGAERCQAAEAVRGRIDWKYLLALDLADAGFDHSILCEFRGRPLRHEAADRLLARVLDAAREGGLLKARGRQRTDSTHVLAAVRDLNRVELVAETLRAALNAIAAVAPAWLCALVPPEWHERYGRRIEDARLPETGPKRDAYVARVGADGFLLLGALDGTEAPPLATALPAVAVLRRVWTRHFERGEVGPDRDAHGGVRCKVAAPATASGLPTMPTPASGQGRAAARRHRCGHQPRPARGLVRQATARAHGTSRFAALAA